MVLAIAVIMSNDNGAVGCKEQVKLLLLLLLLLLLQVDKETTITTTRKHNKRVEYGLEQ